MTKFAVAVGGGMVIGAILGLTVAQPLSMALTIVGSIAWALLVHKIG